MPNSPNKPASLHVPGFKRQSIQLAIFAAISLVLFISLFFLILYVTESLHTLNVQEETSKMDDIGKGLTAQIDELIDNHLSIVQADSKQKQFYSLLKGHTADFEFVSDQIASMVKSGSYINSMFLLNNKGLVVAGITKKGDSMVDVDLSKRAYWKDVSQGKEVIENTISKGAATGLMVFIIAVPIMDENNQLLGAVGLAINWSKFMEKFILPVRIGLHGHAYMFDSKGIMLAHPEQNLILSDLSRLDYVRTAIAQKNGSVRNTQDSEGKVEVFNTVSRTGWIVCLNDTEAELATVSIAKRNFLIAMGLVTYFVLLGLIMLLIRKVITSPLASIKSYAEKVAKGDYQALLSGEFHFELKELSEHVAKMTNELKNKLGFANGVLKGFATPITVYDINNRLTYTNKEMLNLLHLPGEPEQYFGQSPGEFFYADASKESIITKCLRDRKFIQGIEERMQFRDNLSYFIKIDVSQIYDLDGRLIGAITSLVDLTDMREQQHKIERQRDHLAEAAKEAEAVSARITATTLDLAAKIEQFSQGSRDQSNRVAQTTTDMDEMNSSVQQVAKNVDQVLQLSEGARQKAENGASVVQQVVQEISGIQKQALKLKTDMTTLGQQAQGIGQVLNVISDIADQTNLLALNAAIEAARAGEAGRGFAVVADEVRKLAEKTMSATREVGEAIQAIQTGTNMNVANVDMTVQKIDQANNLADQSGQALTQIVNMVDQTSDQVRPMAQASERQTAASERIYQSMEDISRISNETSVGLGHSATDVNDLANQFQVLKGLIEDMLLSEDGGNKVRALR